MSFAKPLQSPQPKNNGVDPYADGYDPSLEDDYGMGDLYGDDYGDMGEGDMFIEGEDGMGGSQGPSMDLGQVESEIKRLYTLLEEYEGSATKAAALKNEIDALKKRINQIAFKEGEELQAAIGEMFADMAVVETKITGIDPTTGMEDPTVALTNSIEQTLEAVKNNENLSEKSKDEYTEKLEKLLVSLETPGMGDPDMLNDQYMQIKEEFEQEALHPSSITDVSNYTGIDQETLLQLCKKHDIDPNNLSTPPGPKESMLVQEILLQSSSAGLLEEEKSLVDALKDQIKANTDAAHAQNQAAQSSDTSQADSINFDPFKFLYDAKLHQDDGSEAIKGIRKDIATEVSKILSALYGKEITPVDDPEKAGMILFDGKELNVLAAGGQGKIDFSDSEPDWPDVTLVEIYVDDEGDGKTSVPPWMREAKYPYHIYDTGGACHTPSGNWNW